MHIPCFGISTDWRKQAHPAPSSRLGIKSNGARLTHPGDWRPIGGIDGRGKQVLKTPVFLEPVRKVIPLAA